MGVVIGCAIIAVLLLALSPWTGEFIDGEE